MLPPDDGASSVLSPNLKDPPHLRQLKRILSASLKAFSIGAGLKGGLSIFSFLAKLRSSPSSPPPFIPPAKDTLRYGLFLAAFAATFTSVDELIAFLGGRSRTATWRPFAAGLIAGPSMLLTGVSTQHKSLAIYILMRALVLASRCGIKSRCLGRYFAPLTWQHGDVFLMCLSSSQILSSFILNVESLPPSYRSFLIKHGGKSPAVLNAIRDLAYRTRVGDVRTPCSVYHAGQSCTAHSLLFLTAAYKRALQVYLPVYLIPALIVHRQDLLKSPYSILAKGILGTARSSLFLSLYCSSAWSMMCFWFRLLGTFSVPMMVLGLFPTGVALAVEKKSRRIEISLYCFVRAIESFITSMAELGFFPQFAHLKRADVVVFSIATAIIMNCYARERDVFRSKYLNVLDWVFGVPEESPKEP